MGGFIYALPGAGAVNEKRIEEAGLMGIFGDILPDFSQRHTASGPGGGDRMLICTGNDVQQLYYKPEEQTWQVSLNGKFHIGLINNDKPAEMSLRRKRMLDGHFVELGDGGKWLVPVARIITGGSALPQTLILGKDGEIIREELPKYARFGAKAMKLWEDFRIENKFAEGKLQFSPVERLKFAIEALAWNYRIEADEANMLKLLTTENIGEIMTAIIDVPTLIKVAEEAKKKNTGDAPTAAG